MTTRERLARRLRFWTILLFVQGTIGWAYRIDPGLAWAATTAWVGWFMEVARW